jgi:urease accessory protein
MAPLLKTLVAAAAVVVVLPFAQPVFAHHVMGGELPSTVWHGLLSGLGHPIIGIDHFAFTVGVGMMSYLAGRIVLLPLLFVAGSVLGCFIHIQGFDLPWPEPTIGLTVAAAAAIVATRSRIPIVLLVLLFGIAGVFHGYAYGESIVGAQTTPLSAYVIGFGVIQYLVAVGSGALLRLIVGRDYVSERMLMRLSGGGIALVAVLAFVSLALSR